MPAPGLTPWPQRLGALLGLATFVGLWFAPLSVATPQAPRLAAVAGLAVVLWVTEAIPLAVTAIAAPALAVVLQVASPVDAMAPFAHPLIFLFLGGFFLAEGLAAQGVDRRVALWLMARPFVRGRPARATTALAAIGFGFSMWISNTATTAMLIPVALGLSRTMGTILGVHPAAASPDPAPPRGPAELTPADGDAASARPQPSSPEAEALRRFTGGMCLALAYASSLGGTATPIGTGPNVIGLAMLERSTGVTIDFFSWIAFALPSALLMTALMVRRVHRTFPPPVERIEGLTAHVRAELHEMGPMRPGERRAIAVFALAVAGWLAPSVLPWVLGPEHAATRWAATALHEGMVAMLAASLLFVLPSEPRGGPLLLWERAMRIDWGTLFLLGGGLALGELAFSTGLARAIGEGVLALGGPVAAHPLGLMAIATTLVLFMTELTSNTATTSMMLPVLVGIAQAAGNDPLPTALSVTLAASYAFMLPVGTPPNAMAYGTGTLKLQDMIRQGFALDLFAIPILLASGAWWIPWVLGR
jgi:sodium-dependent dicarboxylate transporter 2/3/5